MRFVQLNIWDGGLLRYAVEFLKRIDADIVNLQEVSAGMPSAESEYFSVYDKLRRTLKYKHNFYSPIVEGKFGNHPISKGQMILSKYPITYRKTIFTHGRLKKHSNFSEEDLNIRLLQHAKVNANGRTINVLNYHGYLLWGITKMGNKATESQCKKILEYINTIDQSEQKYYPATSTSTPNHTL